MSETLELQQVICPSCKQAVSSFSPFEAEVECPYCHNKAFNPLITAKKVPVPERIIPFQTTEKDFERVMTDHLVELDHVPTDVFQHIRPQNVIKAYLPMFHYEGRDTSEPYLGVDSSFSELCLAHEADDIPKPLRECCQHYPYNAAASKAYDPKWLSPESGNHPLIYALDTDAEVSWAKYGYSHINYSDLKQNGRYILVPFWFVYYTYNNEQFYFLMDGVDANKYSLSAPRSTEIDHLRHNRQKREERIRKITKWSCIILDILIWIILVAITSFSNGKFIGLPATFAAFLVTTIFWGLVSIPILLLLHILNKKSRQRTDKQIKNLLERSKKLRRQAANKLG